MEEEMTEEENMEEMCEAAGVPSPRQKAEIKNKVEKTLKEDMDQVDKYLKRPRQGIVTVTSTPDGLVVSLKGEFGHGIDDLTYDELRHSLSTATGPVIIDLMNVGYLDSIIVKLMQHYSPNASFRGEKKKDYYSALVEATKLKNYGVSEPYKGEVRWLEVDEDGHVHTSLLWLPGSP